MFTAETLCGEPHFLTKPMVNEKSMESWFTYLKRGLSRTLPTLFRELGELPEPLRVCQEELPTVALHQSSRSQFPEGNAYRLARSSDEFAHFFLCERQPDSETAIGRVSKLVG